MPTRRALPLIALTALVMGAGCGSQAPAGGGADHTAADVLQAVRLFGALDSVDVDARGTLTAGAPADAGAAGVALRRGIRWTAAGGLDMDAADLRWTASLGGLTPFDGRLVTRGGDAVIGLLGTDSRLDAPPAAVRALPPVLPVRRLPEWMADPAAAGYATVDGRWTIHLRGVVAPGAVGADALAILRAAGVARTGATLRRTVRELDTVLTGRRMDLWAGVFDLRPARVRIDLAAARLPEGLLPLRAVRATVDLRIAPRPAPVAPRMPDPAEALDLGRALRLLGG